MNITISNNPYIHRKSVERPATHDVPATTVAAEPIRFEGAKSSKNDGTLARLRNYNLPVAALSIAGMMAPGLAQLQAAVTPESDKLVKVLASSKEEDLIEAALVNLSSINERDAVPYVKKIIAEGKVNEATLNAAMKAAGRLGATSSDAEKAELSKIILPYLLKVVVQDKDKNVKFTSFEEAGQIFQEDPKNTKVKDAGLSAARALGQINHPATITQLSKAAQDKGVAKDIRWLSLEAIKNAPANASVDKDMVALYERLNPETEAPFVAQVVDIFLKHNVKEGWDKIEKLFAPKTPATPPTTPPTAPVPSTPVTPPSTTKSEDIKTDTKQPNRKGVGTRSSEEDEGGPMFARPSESMDPAQSIVLKALLKSKKQEAAPMVLKQMAKEPNFFRANMRQALEFFKASSPEIKKQLVSTIDATNAEKLVREANPKKSYYPDAKAEQADDAKVMQKAATYRQLSIVLTALMQVKDAGVEYQKIFSNSLENPGLRSLGVAASAFIKDTGSIPKLMDIAVENTEDVDLRFDAMSAVMEITTPPLAQGLEANSNRIQFMERYLNTFSGNEKFTQSVFKAELFNDIREARKLLMKMNAPLKDIDEATLRLVDKKIRSFTMAKEMKEALKKSPEFKAYEKKMLDYVSKEPNADGFLRTLMIGALGEMESEDARSTLQDLIKDPLARTKIADMASSNDMMMFPGYTKQTVANSTRLAAIQALGKAGNMDDAEYIEKGLRTDDRRLHMYTLKALGDIGSRTDAAPSEQNNGIIAKRAALSQRMIRQIPKVNLNASARLNNHFQRLYAETIDKMGGGKQLLELMDKTTDTVLKRAIANGMIYNGKNLDNPKVAQYLVNVAMGVDELHKMGIDGRGTEVAIIDGDYLNEELEGMKGKVILPDWGRTKDPALRESFHDEAVASAIAGRKGNVIYGIAPGVDKIYSYAAWDDNINADRNTPMEEVDGMLRAIDDIIAKKISGKSKVSVVNMSLGGTSGLLYADEEGLKTYVDKFAARLDAASKAGITFVISAGNEGGAQIRHHLVGTMNVLGFNKTNGKLVQNNGVILVGASDTQGTKDRSKHTISWFSSIGDAFNGSGPNIVAPGTNIPLPTREANGDVTLDEMDGTSFSAPITAATLLLVNQAAGKPLETEAVKQLLAKTAYQLEDTPKFQQGPGGLDAVKAVEAAKNMRVSDDFNKFMESLGSYLKMKEQPMAKPETPATPVESGKK